jgi:hypothetical protein
VDYLYSTFGTAQGINMPEKVERLAVNHQNWQGNSSMIQNAKNNVYHHHS